MRVIKLLILGVVIWAVLLLLVPELTSEEFKAFVDGFGIFGPIAVIGYIIFSHILAPVAGTPVVFSSIAIFGIYETMLYIYIGGIISAAVNFFISRKLGRAFVIRFVGAKTMREIDEFAESSGTVSLILSRLLGFAIFEVISYAAGLTNISFKKYFIITVIFSGIPGLVFAFLFKDVNFSAAGGIFVWIGLLAVTGIIFSFLLKKYLVKKKEKAVTR